MSAATTATEPGAALDRAIAERLASAGWGVFDRFLPAALVDALRRRAQARMRQGGFRAAGVGARAEVRRRLRGDVIAWLDPGTTDPVERAFLARIERLRRALNEALYLGLFDYEGHFACYRPGASYRRHCDVLRGTTERAVTVVCYLNESWRDEDEGALRLFLPGDPIDVAPIGGRAVVFLSERFEHEVRPARRERWSLTGWLRRRAPLPLPTRQIGRLS